MYVVIVWHSVTGMVLSMSAVTVGVMDVLCLLGMCVCVCLCVCVCVCVCEKGIGMKVVTGGSMPVDLFKFSDPSSIQSHSCSF